MAIGKIQRALVFKIRSVRTHTIKTKAVEFDFEFPASCEKGNSKFFIQCALKTFWELKNQEQINLPGN